MTGKPLTLTVNGVAHRVAVDPERTLLSVLRDDLDLTGSKYGCGEGQCGACTVLVGDEPVRSCLTRVGAIGDRPVRTIEGLEGPDGQLHPLQQAFLDHDAFQCAYCTSGMIVAGVGLLEKNADPSDEAIIDAMRGNVCRCGTYPRILAAIRQAAGARRGGAR